MDGNALVKIRVTLMQEDLQQALMERAELFRPQIEAAVTEYINSEMEADFKDAVRKEMQTIVARCFRDEEFRASIVSRILGPAA